MKLKFINLLLASVLLVGSAQVFTSCKDNEADLYVNLKEETLSLSEKLEADEQLISGLRTDLDKEINNRKAAEKAIENTIDGLNTQLGDLAAQLEALKQSSASDDQIENVQNQINDAVEALNKNTSALAAVKTDIETLQNAVDNLDGIWAYVDGQISVVDGKIQGINGQIVDINEDITNIKLDVVGIDGRVTTIESDLLGILARLDALEAIDHDDIFTSLQALEAAMETARQDIDGLIIKVGTIGDTLEALGLKVDGIETDVTNLTTFVNTWQTYIEAIPDIQNTADSALQKATEAYAQANTNMVAIENLQQVLDTEVERLENAIREKASIEYVEYVKTQLEESIAGLQEQINTLSTEIENVRAEAFDNYKASLKFTMMTCAALRILIDENYIDLNTKISDLKDAYDLLQQAIDGKVSESEVVALIQAALVDYATKTDLEELAGNIGALDVQLGILANKVSENQRDIEELNNAVRPLIDRVAELAERVNGVIIQQVDNKVFGTFNTPVGINSNMLLGWWGQVENSRGVEFPTADTGYGYKSGEQYIGLTEQDLVNLGITPEEFDGKKYLMETNEAGEGVLGTIYMTVNPSNANLDGKTFSIVNSLGKATPITINPVASNHELTFGYTRGGTDNGFYEAQATIDISNNVAIDAVKFTLNDNLRSTVASIIKEGRSSINATTIAKLGKALYSQVNGILPALAVSCSWDDSEQGAMQVTSSYSLAAAAIHAPSLSVLNPFDNSGKHIPNVPDISGIQDRFNTWYDDLKGRIHIDLGLGTFNITLDDVEIKINDVKVSLQDVDKTVSGTGGATTDATIVGYQLKVNVKNASDDVVGTVDQWIEIPIKPISATASVTVDLTTLLNQMETAVNSALNDVLNGPSGVAADMTAQINNELGKVADKISTEVNSLFSTMQTNIDTQISTILNGIQSDINGKLESVLGTVSNVSDRVQSLINRLNDVLTEPSHYIQPVLLYKAGSKVGIFSTSAAVPSQFVISTGNTAGVYVIPTTYTLESVVPLYKKFVAVTKVWANGDASKTNVASVMNDANNQGKMNKVLDPKNTLVGLKIQKGYTYEIAYQGMGYDGKVSGRKYYVTVK